jgi:hypothetical protein
VTPRLQIESQKESCGNRGTDFFDGHFEGS